MLPFVPPPLPNLNRARILIAEDEPIIALDLACAVEDAGGQVVGPAASVREALSFVAKNGIRAAILDVDLLDGDIGPVLEELTRRGVPVIIHTGGGLPAALGDRFRDIEVYRKPISSSVLVGHVAERLKH